MYQNRSGLSSKIKDLGEEFFNILLKPVNSNTSSSNGIVRIVFTAQFNRLFRPNNTQQYGAFFLSIKFNGEKLKKAHPGFEDYDYSSPWNIQVGIYDGKDEEVDFSKTGPNPSQWHIVRHKKNGEVPDHKSRYKEWPREYSYKLS